MINLEIIYHLCFICFVLSSIGLSLFFSYPLTLLILSRCCQLKQIASPSFDRTSSDTPHISLIVVVRNGEKLIEEKIKNSLALDYPSEKLELIFFSDGSSDRTESIIEKYREKGIRLMNSAIHKGKIHAMNLAVPEAIGNIIAFSDVDAILEKRALLNLVRHFDHESIGGVCGQRLILKESTGLKDAQSRYIHIDSLIKKLESRLGSITSNDGKLYAIRKSLFMPIKEGVTDDLSVALGVKRHGKRFIFDNTAQAAIRLPSRNPAHEITRRRRIVSGSLRCMMSHREVFNPLKHGDFAFGLFINKVLRRFMPFFLILIWMSSLVLSHVSQWFYLLFLIQSGAYLISLSHLFISRMPARWGVFPGMGSLSKLISIGFYFCIGNIGTLLGVMDFFMGRTVTRWDPIKEDVTALNHGIDGSFEQISKTPKVLVVDLSTRFGGTSARVIALMKEFPKHHIALAGLIQSPVTRQAQAAGIPVFKIGRSKIDPMIFFSLVRHIRKEQILILDTQNIQSKIWSILVTMISPITLVSTLNSWYAAEYGNSLKGRIYQLLERLTAGRTARYIAVSEDICNKLKSIGVKPGRIAHIPNAVSVKKNGGMSYSPNELKNEFFLPEDAFVCCAVGRLVEAKGFDHLIDAFAGIENPRICCIIIGEGRLYPLLATKIRDRRLEKRVILAGHMDRADVLNRVTASDLFLMPSISEGTPLALLEAAALARPIIASRVGGIPEMLSHNTHALLIPADDSEALQNAIMDLFNHPEKAHYLAANAHAHVTDSFSMKEQVRLTQQAYQRAMV